MTLRVCNKLGCPELCDAKQKYCDAHKLQGWSTSTWKKPAGWDKIRASVLFKANHLCHYCGAKANEVDHVIPLSQGGTNKADNLVASCKTCNARKNIQQRRSGK